MVSTVIRFSLSPGLISEYLPALTSAFLISATVAIVITRYATGGERALTG